MRYTIVDIETDGLLETVTKIHCLSYSIILNGREIDKGSITNYNQIKQFLTQQNILVGHNIIRYDVPVLEKILNIKVTARLIDTLGLSWYLYPIRLKHGLELWGEELGVPKPVITDWQNLSIRDYVHRCESDVKINKLLFFKQLKYLKEIYEEDSKQIDNLINYLGFKLDCAREQEEVKCKLDKKLIEDSLSDLIILKEEKENILTEAMPRSIKYKEVSKPSKMEKIDGSPTVKAIKWYELLEENNLPANYEDSIMVKVSDEPGNPGSTIQLKDWLYSLGWEPITFEHRANSAGEVKAIPQIYGDDGVCESIKALYDIEPALESLDMLTLINHRISIFESYLDTMDSNNFTIAEIHGFTNTLRFRHKKPIVNLPKVFKFYGEQIRGAIIPPSEEYLLCGADMTSLEDTTKQHYMYFFDPEYVEQMRVPGFDPHLDIAVLSKMLTEEQAEAHKQKLEDHSQIRGRAKVVNFAGVYGAGPPKIALTSGMTLSEAKKLHTIYWQRNKAVKLVEKSCAVKTIGEQMWLLNPVSGFWYSLRYLKDRFSTLNQGTGVYCFDLWVREVRSRGIKITLQYHDEVVIALLKEQKEEVDKSLRDSIDSVNEKVKLNVPLGVDVQFGINYAKIH
jgi:hypothetical protein